MIQLELTEREVKGIKDTLRANTAATSGATAVYWREEDAEEMQEILETIETQENNE